MTPWAVAHQLCPWNSPGKKNGVSSHSCLQGIFLTQEWNPGLLHCRRFLFPGASESKELPTMQETWVWFLGQEDPLEKGMATHYTVISWRIPWTEEPGGLLSLGSQRVGQDWVTDTFTRSSVLAPSNEILIEEPGAILRICTQRPFLLSPSG